MPLIDSNSSSSTGLNVNAISFVPTMKVENNQDPEATRSGGQPRRNTGAVPKNNNRRPNRYYEDNRRNWRSSASGGWRNREENREVKEIQKENVDESGESSERKFYKNNYNDRNRFKRPNSHTSNNNNHRNPARSSKKPNEAQISQRERLIKELETNNLECMICCEKVKAFQPTFSCKNCYHIQHLGCIKTWVKNSKNDAGEWRCPACNQISINKPGEYMCFCGKLKNPPVNRNDLAHSCGDMCLSTSSCPHPCQLRCHPGPHETCQALVKVNCGCGKSSKPYQCSMKAQFDCEEICDKVLNCTIHRCAKTCHQGDCGECQETISCTCYCGSDKKEINCIAENLGVTSYACETICGKNLSCENHKCIQKCHDGPCKECSLMPKFIKNCPCGKTSIKEGERISCLDDVKTCTSKCSKPLKCGPLSSPHKCMANCHSLECPPCTQTSKVRCRCGRKEETIPCKDLTNSDIRCKKKCLKYKTCGKHKCNTECCIELEHVCPQNCNKLLDCKKHRCQKSCHIGNCRPCHRVSFDEMRCECGLTVIYPPIPCGTKIRECLNPCKRKHVCDHPVKHNCHSEPTCPPCVFLTKKFCYGKHDFLNTIPCNQESFGCGLPCKKPLKCGRHSCIKNCHIGDCEKSKDVCTQKCTKKREDCSHNCNAKCHDGDCPDAACREKVEVTCSCGNLKAQRSCEQVEYENRKLQRVQMTMHDMNDENATNLGDLIGNFKKTTKILECNNDCKTLERNRRLEIGFKLINPTLVTLPKFVPNYSQHVRNFYKKDSAFVNMVHEKLTELVKLSKESKAPYRSVSFPVMNRDKRHVVHDLGEQFGVETKAYDAEPNRNIIATASKESCWLPSMSISEVIQKENGLRLPPTSY